MHHQSLHLRNLSFGVRLGMTLACLVLLGGFAASMGHLFLHDNKRDERPGLTVDDVKGVYHGIRSKSPLLTALQKGHPEPLKQPDRDRLVKWLTGPDMSKVYDDPDLGELAPAEIIAANCASCHSRTSKDPVAKEFPLDRSDDVLKAAVSRDISPNSLNIVVASTHTHALSLGMLAVLLGLLAAFTRWPGGLIGLLATGCGGGLLADIGGWWLTRNYEQFAYMVMAGGGTFVLCSVLLILLIIADLWGPTRDSGSVATK